MNRSQQFSAFAVFFLMSVLGSTAQPDQQNEWTGRVERVISSEADRLEQVEMLRKAISVPIIRQQVCDYKPGENKVIVIRNTVNLDTGAREELRAEFPYPTDPYDSLFNETAMDVPLNSHLVSGRASVRTGASTGWRYELEPDKGGKWRMDFMAGALWGGLGSFLQQFLRLADYPHIKWRMDFLEAMASEAQQEGDAETAQFYMQERQCFLDPGPYYETKAFVRTNASGKVLRAFLQDDRHAVHIGPEGLIRSITVTSPKGQLIRRVDNRFVSDYDFMISSPDRIADIHPFFGSYRADQVGIKKKRQFKYIGIKFARVGGEWIVTSVHRETPAEVAGLRKDDILREINQTAIKGAGVDLVNSLFDAGDQVALSIRRGEQSIPVLVQKREYVWLYPVDLPPPFK